MDSVYEKHPVLNGVKVRTLAREMRRGAVEMNVEAGTTGRRGNVARRKSARAFFSMECRRGDFYVVALEDDNGDVTGFDLCCCGDEALEGLRDALTFALRALRVQD